ncbi:MAG: hypothetical protein P9M13_02115 [Candidatus Ancaeobacter aquaticus]|nr:hypothetical protein [Candidatus Ancaeobacter aquaticus]
MNIKPVLMVCVICLIGFHSSQCYPEKTQYPLHTVSVKKVPIYQGNTPIGYLYYGAQYCVLEDTEDSIRVRLWSEKSEFYGWIKKTDLTSPLKIPEIAHGNKPHIQLSELETEKRLLGLLKVPYLTQYAGSKTYNTNIKGAKNQRVIKRTQRIYKKLPVNELKKADGYADFTVYLEWIDIQGIDFVLEEKISVLKTLAKTAHKKYFWIIKEYIDSLKELRDKKEGNFKNIFERAEARRKNMGHYE